MPRTRLWIRLLRSAALLSVLAAPLSGVAEDTAIRYLYVVPHSHLDVGFTTSPQQLMALEKEYLDQAMDYAEQYPAYRWTVESVWQLDQWLARTSDPAEVDRLRRLIGEGRIEVAGGYANLHQGLLGDEELNRFLYPARRYEEAWGIDVDTVFVNDVPGSSWALPQVLRSGGVRNLVAGVNEVYGGRLEIPLRDALFSWQGLDGSEVLTWVSHESYAEGIFSYWLSAGYAQMAEHTRAMIDGYAQGGYPYDAILVLEAFDNDGPDTVLGALGNIERWNREHASPQIVVSTPAAFFGHVRERYGDSGFTRYRGDWSGRWENLDASTPVSTAQLRATREAVRQAESLAALSAALGSPPASPAGVFDRVYRDLLTYDEHSGPGGGYGLTLEEVQANDRYFRQHTLSAYACARRLLGDGLSWLAGAVPSNVPALVVWNGVSWPRTDVVEVSPAELQALLAAAPGSGGGRLVDLATGSSVALERRTDGTGYAFIAEDVPAYGYRLYGAVPGAPAPAAPAVGSSSRLENAFYRVTVDPRTGSVVSLYDKRAGRELVSASSFPMNALVRADQAEAVVWGGGHPVPTGTVTLRSEVGVVESRLRVARASSPLAETVITLPTGLPRVELRNTLERGRTPEVPREEQTHWYFTTMPFALGPSGFTGRFQGPKGWLSPQADWLPGTGHNARVARRATDLRAADGFGVTLANRETYLSSYGSTGFWNSGEPEAPTLFLALFARTDEVETVDRGWVRFETWEPGAPSTYASSFALTSSGGGFDPVAAERFGAGFAAPLLVAGVARGPGERLPGPAGSLLGTSNEAVAVVTLKRADYGNPDGGDLILRLEEVAGRRAEGVAVRLPFPLAWAEANGLGEQRETAVALPADPLTVSLSPHETLTVRLRPKPAR